MIRKSFVSFQTLRLEKVMKDKVVVSTHVLFKYQKTVQKMFQLQVRAFSYSSPSALSRQLKFEFSCLTFPSTIVKSTTIFF